MRVVYCGGGDFGQAFLIIPMFTKSIVTVHGRSLQQYWKRETPKVSRFDLLSPIIPRFQYSQLCFTWYEPLVVLGGGVCVEEPDGGTNILWS
jgi:hypothetical protein